MEEKKKFSELLKDNLQKLVIAAVSIVYVFQGLFAIQKKDATIWDVLGSIGLSIIVGMIISSSMKSLGLRDGRRSKAFVGSMKAYGEAKEKATQYFDKIQAWCSYKNDLELEARKKEIIQNAGLKWQLYKIGYYDANIPEEKEQIAALEHAKKCKIERLTTSEMLSDLPSGKFMKRRFGQTENEYKTRGFMSDFISKTLTGVICGLYGLSPLFTEGDVYEIWAGILWNLIQIMMWLTFGMMAYQNSKTFMEDEYRQTHLIQKTELLNEFMVTCQNAPEAIAKYEDAEKNSVQQYIGGLTDDQRKKDIPA